MPPECAKLGGKKRWWDSNHWLFRFNLMKFYEGFLPLRAFFPPLFFNYLSLQPHGSFLLLLSIKRFSCVWSDTHHTCTQGLPGLLSNHCLLLEVSDRFRWFFFFPPLFLFSLLLFSHAYQIPDQAGDPTSTTTHPPSSHTHTHTPTHTCTRLLLAFHTIIQSI